MRGTALDTRRALIAARARDRSRSETAAHLVKVSLQASKSNISALDSKYFENLDIRLRRQRRLRGRQTDKPARASWLLNIRRHPLMSNLKSGSQGPHWSMVGISGRRDQSAVGRVPAPQPVIGQFGAAPPAMDRIVPAEIFGLAPGWPPERGEPAATSLVALPTLRSSCISSVNGPSSRPDTAGCRQSQVRPIRLPTSRSGTHRALLPYFVAKDVVPDPAPPADISCQRPPSGSRQVPSRP